MPTTDRASTSLTGGRDRITPAPDRLHLGAGAENPSDAVTIDRVDWGHTDYVQDVREPWPFVDDCFDAIVANHVLEHVADPLPVFREAARTLRPAGTFTVRIPVGIDARADPTHEREWTWRTPVAYTEAAEPWQPGATAALPFELDARDLRLWSHWLAGYLSPVVDRLADCNPIAAQNLPGCSGELTAVYRRLD